MNKYLTYNPSNIPWFGEYPLQVGNSTFRSNENPGIGILLCQEADRSVVEYAMSRSLNLTMVAEYKRQLIPKEVLQHSLAEFTQFLKTKITINMPTLNCLFCNEDLKSTSREDSCLLEEVSELGAGNKDTGNMLIQGDNLQTLKALLPFYAGQAKCIYIDPLYSPV